MVTKTRPLQPSGVEALDDRGLDNELAQTMLDEIALTNVLFGGNAAVKFGLMKLKQGESGCPSMTILDIGAGAGDGTRRACEVLGEHRTVPIALDHHKVAARMCSAKGITSVVGDIRRLPLRPDSVDIAIVSMVLHHLPRLEAVALIAQLDAAARLGVVIADLRRSPVAATAFDIASRILHLHAVTRRDGVLSIRRGFTASELADIIDEAGVNQATVHRRIGWRVVAYWRARHENS